MNGGKESGSKIGKLRVGLTRPVIVGRFAKVLEIRRGDIEKLEDNVDDFGLAGPRFDKWRTDTVYTSIIVTVFKRRIEDGLKDRV